MELAILNPAFRRARLVENWNSLIWTERYSQNGDFEMTSYNISEVMSLLPLGGPSDPPTLVALRESNVPMVVENHKLEKPKNSAPKIVTTGRSFETVLDRRVTLRAITSGVARAPWTVEATSAALAAYTVAKNIVVDGVATSLDIIPEINLINGVTDSGVAQKYPVEPKELYGWILETLALGKYGLKSSVPISPSDVKITIQTYKGTDRSTSIVFDVTLDQFDQATYLLSKLGYKNTMITATKNGMESANTGTAYSGLARRVDYQDVSSEVTLTPGADLTNLTINKGKVALADRLPTTLFSGEIAEKQAAKYGVDYFLGDTVKLAGEYGLTQSVRIAEFVRTEDATGTKAYPTFEAVSA